METIKKINIKLLIAIVALVIVISSLYLYKNYSDIEKNKKYFDIYLSNLYNDLDQAKIDDNFNLLAFNSNPDISFFANLKKPSLANLDIFRPLEKNLILIKYSVFNKDLNLLNTLKNENPFQETASINYLNNNLDNISITDLNSASQNSFFSKAVKLYLNDI